MRQRRRLLAVFGAAGLLLGPRGAAAQTKPWLTGWYAPSGLVIGASQHPDRPNGLLVGVEQSLVYQAGPRASFWGGLMADVLHDFGPSWTRFSFGPEVGYGAVGLDGGVVGVVRDGKVERGLQGRLLLTIGVVALYGRAGRVMSGEAESFTEVGVLLKWPWSLGLPPATAPR